MSISLTWASYALIVSLCLGVYYAIIGFVFYHNRIKLAVSAKGNVDAYTAFPQQSDVDEIQSKNLFGEPILDNDHFDAKETNPNPESQDFVDEIVAYLSSCDEDITKEKLLQTLKRIIRKYPSLLNCEHKYELNQLMAISTENYCSIHVSADELSELWRE